jgi:dihydroorotate dehydrogenase
VSAFGLTFPNPVGLAAGYDKDARAWRALSCLGFGHVEVGTVTPEPQPGNPLPRIFRLPADRGLINRMGFPSRGADYVLPRLRGPRPGGMVLGVNIGKQKETPLERAAGDYEALIDKLAPGADYMVVNISSPNTPQLRRLQTRQFIEELLTRVDRRRAQQRQRLGRPLPVLVKLAPDLSDAELDGALEAVQRSNMDGVIATNSTIARPHLASPHAGEAGGLSGAPLTRRSTEVVARIHALTGGRLPVIGVGGVFDAGDVQAKLDAGAVLVQVYTGLIYGGPSLVRRILRGLN